jgi:zinc protease
MVGACRAAFLSSALAMATALPARAEGAAPKALESLGVSRPAPVLFRLENGLRVVLERVPEQPLVAVVAAYEAGWAHDPPGHAGLAHLVEHLTFRGSRHLPGRGIYEQLEGVGSVRWNGTTSHDLATYHSVVPAERVAIPLWIESERLAFTLESFTQSSLELERQRVRKELLQRGRVNPTFDLFVNQALYPEGHPYRLTSDEISDVLATELTDASWFHQTHYRPDNGYLIVVGGFSAQTEALIRRYFAPIANPPRTRPALHATRRVFTARETLTVRQPVYVDNRLLMVFPAPEPGSGDAAAFAILTELLAGVGPWSLDSVLMRGAGLSEWVRVETEPASLGGVVQISTQLRPGVAPEAAERAIEAQLARLAQFDDPPTLREVLQSLTLSSLSRLGDPLEAALAQLQSLRSSGKPASLAATLADFRRVQPRDLADVTRRFLNPTRRLSARLLDAGRGCQDGCVSHEIEGR